MIEETSAGIVLFRKEGSKKLFLSYVKKIFIPNKLFRICPNG